ncbi:MAG: HEPN domain-containing protein [Sulfuritalea sp.]|nr:HEPN domain-containing protein [Sulfuritalea sp.]
MTPFIEEAERLLRLARRDYQTCAILGSHPDAQIAPICFHAQQCVEKSLKAVMTANQIYFRYTHDLGELTNLLTGAGITPPFTAQELQRLTPSAVELRYDEGVPLLTREEATDMATRTLAWAEALVAKVQ